MYPPTPLPWQKFVPVSMQTLQKPQDDAAIAFGLVFGYLILGVAVYWQARYHRPY